MNGPCGAMGGNFIGASAKFYVRISCLALVTEAEVTGGEWNSNGESGKSDEPERDGADETIMRNLFAQR